MKKIKFIYNNSLGEEYKDIISHPISSTKTIPSWYKTMPERVDNSKKSGISKKNKFASNSTMKHCSPFLDALTFGYTYTLPIDVEFSKDENNNIKINWRNDYPFITEHSKDQHPKLPPAHEEMDFVLKWSFPFVIETPPGYSCLFTHPLNRHDLPFRTLSGVVDTDVYAASVQFPFQLIKDFEENLIIEKGTPVCQIFPFKREDWKSSREDMTIKENHERMFQLHSKIVRSYKTQWWKRKTFL
jgi:hypothetical protein